jgi:hypothetical protein
MRCLTEVALRSALSQGSKGDPDDPVVGGLGDAAAVAVGGQHPQRPVWGAGDVAQPTEVADVQPLPVLPVEADPVQALASQAGQVDLVADDRDAARGRLGDRPGRDRVDEAPVVAWPFLGRPAVVAARLDQVELVDLVLAELRGEQPARASQARPWTCRWPML